MTASGYPMNTANSCNTRELTLETTERVVILIAGKRKHKCWGRVEELFQKRLPPPPPHPEKDYVDDGGILFPDKIKCVVYTAPWPVSSFGYISPFIS